MSSHVSGGSTEAAADAAPSLMMWGDIPRDGDGDGDGDDEADAGLMLRGDDGCGGDADAEVDADADTGRRSRRIWGRVDKILSKYRINSIILR